MATSNRADLVPFSPFLTQKNGLDALIVDRNLLAIKQALDNANATIIRIANTVNRIINGDTVININIPGGTAGPPGMGADAADESGSSVGSAASAAMARARFWISTADPSVPYGVDMSTLGTGVLQQSVAGGVATPAAFALGTGLIPYGNGSSLLATTATFGFNAANSTLAIGIAPGSALANARLHATGATASGINLVVENTSSAASAFCSMVYLNDVAKRADIYFCSSTYGTPDGAPNSIVFSTAGTSGSVIFSPKLVRTLSLDGVNSNFETGHLFLTQAAPQFLEKQGTGGLFVGTLGAVQLGLYTTNITRLNISAGGEVGIVAAATQAWYRVDGANFENVTATWGNSTTTAAPNTWNVVAGKGGAGVVRDINIDATSAANITIAGVTSYLYAAGASQNIRIGVSGGSATQAEIACGFSRASSAGMLVDAIKFNNPGNITITGGTNVTTATGANFAVFDRPVYDGGGVAKTVSLAATVYIKNAPLDQNGVTITNPYALWVDDGDTRLDGSAFIAKWATINGASAATNDALALGHTTLGDRDHVRMFVAGGALYDHPNNSYVLISPSNQQIAGVDFGGTGILATFQINSLTYSPLSGSPSISGAAALYIPSAPTLSSVTGPSYAIWVDAGSVRIDGSVALGGGAAATLGTIGGSGPAAAAQAKWIPLNSDGTQYWVPAWS